MAQPWAIWTDQQWLGNAGAYHAARLTADAWGALDDTKRNQALTSARTELTPWIDNPNYPLAVYEQSLWLTTEDAKNSMSDYSSVSVGTGSVSVSYGRSRSTGAAPAWMSPVAWALLEEAQTASGRWSSRESDLICRDS